MYKSNNISIRIVIIDSGISTSKMELGKYVKTSIGYIINNEGNIIEESNPIIEHEHGTLVALIIKYLCAKVEFISLKILNKNLASNGRLLIYAMQKALQFEPHIIHLSAGTTKWLYKFPLKRVANIAKKKDITIISSAHNKGLKSYPAYLKGVIGVKSLPKYSSYKDLKYHKGFFLAPFEAQNLPFAKQLTNRYAKGTSYSAAFISGHVANIIFHKGLSKHSDIIKALKEKQ